MTMPASDLVTASSATSPRPFLAVGVGGAIVGVLDFLYAVIVYSPHHPLLIAQAIASGLLGPGSFRDGPASIVLGVVLHFTIAFGAATVFYLASRKLKFLIRHAVSFGLLYGAVVYGFMHLVVLPLSAFHSGHTPFPYVAAEFVEHWFCVGLPIALSVRTYSP